MGLTGTNKTHVTSIVSDLTTAINALDSSDRAQFGVQQVLVKARTQIIELLRNERIQ